MWIIDIVNILSVSGQLPIQILPIKVLRCLYIMLRWSEMTKNLPDFHFSVWKKYRLFLLGLVCGCVGFIFCVCVFCFVGLVAYGLWCRWVWVVWVFLLLLFVRKYMHLFECFSLQKRLLENSLGSHFLSAFF